MTKDAARLRLERLRMCQICELMEERLQYNSMRLTRRSEIRIKHTLYVVISCESFVRFLHHGGPSWLEVHLRRSLDWRD